MTLTLDNVTAGYGDTTVLRAVDFTVGDGEVVALLGPNGAGKTTLLRSATGFVKARAGRILFEDVDLSAEPPHEYSRRGLCHLPEGRGIFPSLTVQENLRIQSRGRDLQVSTAEAVELFPVLGQRLSQMAGSLSGGEQQMLALARGYITKPRVILVDEPSLGLAPRVIDTIYEVLSRFAKAGISLVIVEQYVQRALDLADRVYILGRGAVIHVGPSNELSPEAVYERYLGIET